MVQSRARAVKVLRGGGSRVFVTELEGGTLTSSAGDLVSLLVPLGDPAFAWGRVWNAVVVGGWL